MFWMLTWYHVCNPVLRVQKVVLVFRELKALGRREVRNRIITNMIGAYNLIYALGAPEALRKGTKSWG